MYLSPLSQEKSLLRGFSEQPLSHTEYHYFLVSSAFQTSYFLNTKCIYTVITWQIFLMMTCLTHLIIFLQNSVRALQMTVFQVVVNKWAKAKHMELLLMFRFSKSGLPTCRQTGEGFCSVLKWGRVGSIGGSYYMLKLKIQRSPGFTLVTKWLHCLWNISVCMKNTLQTLACISSINNACLKVIAYKTIEEGKMKRTQGCQILFRKLAVLMRSIWYWLKQHVFNCKTNLLRNLYYQCMVYTHHYF